MDWLEDELRRALAREDPPDGLGGACDGAERARAVGCAALAGGGGDGGGGCRLRGGVAPAPGEQAKQQVMLALRLASAPVQHIQSEIRGISQ